MRLNTKEYQKYLITNLLNSNKVTLVCNYPFKKQADWIKIEQLLKKNECTFTRIKNKMFIKNINQTLFFNLKNAISGTVLFVQLNDLESFDLIRTNFPIYFLKASNKFYNFKQVSKLNRLDYKSNLRSLNSNLIFISKKLSITLLKVK